MAINAKRKIALTHEEVEVLRSLIDKQLDILREDFDEEEDVRQDDINALTEIMGKLS
jgi:hypothetical protein